MSLWSRPSDSSQELHPKRCVILPSESAKLQRNGVIRGEGCTSSALLRPPKTAGEKPREKIGPPWISQEGSAYRAGEAAAWSTFKVLGHPIYTNVPHCVDRGVGKEWDMTKRKKRGTWMGDGPMFEKKQDASRGWSGVPREERLLSLHPTLASPSFLPRSSLGLKSLWTSTALKEFLSQFNLHAVWPIYRC